jgi:hypothetical protein
MRRRWKRPRLGMAILGITVSMGCNHVHHECDCSPSPSVALTPQPVTLASTGPSVGVENPVQPAPAPPPVGKAAQTLEAVEVTAVA